MTSSGIWRVCSSPRRYGHLVPPSPERPPQSSWEVGRHSIYGVSYMQEAIKTVAGQFGVIILAVMITIFIYTTMLSYGVQLESVCRYLFKADKRVVTFIRILYLLFVLSGVLIDGTIIWPMGGYENEALGYEVTK